MFNKMNIRRYFILSISITKTGQTVLIDRAVPLHLVSCNGIHASVNGFLPTENEIQHIGEFSLILSSGSVHPIHYSVGYSKQPLMKNNRFMPIDEPIAPGSHISGFYQDAGTAKDDKGIFLPYRVNIYLDCKAQK
jgi:hypothetical protein